METGNVQQIQIFQILFKISFKIFGNQNFFQVTKFEAFHNQVTQSGNLGGEKKNHNFYLPLCKYIVYKSHRNEKVYPHWKGR